MQLLVIFLKTNMKKHDAFLVQVTI